MTSKLLLPALAAATLGWASSCGGGGGGGSSGGSSANDLRLLDASNGFGLLVPHQIQRLLPNGQLSGEVIAIRSNADLVDNVTTANPVLPVTEWPSAPSLPTGEPGNHYIYARFTQPLAVANVLASGPQGQLDNGLLDTITVTAIDPATGVETEVAGQAFIGGRTYATNANGNVVLQKWVRLDDSGKPVANPDIDNDGDGTPDGLGFPGTESLSYSGGGQLLADSTFLFVADTDGDLTTHEMFPFQRQIRLTARTTLKATNGEFMKERAVASTTVGTDVLRPEVQVTGTANSAPVVTPEFGATDVDPATTISIAFTEPVQPRSVGALPTGGPPAVSTALQIEFGPASQTTNVPFSVLPESIYDFTVWTLTPSFAFPGTGTSAIPCGSFSTVNITLVNGGISDLVQLTPGAPSSTGGNLNALPANSFFVTGQGPGLVNAPVAPDVIYAVRQGSDPSVSVIDLNGFGQSTGNPAFDFTYQSFPKGNSNFPNNPNFIQFGASLLPPLTPGTCTVDGGSAGVFTLTLDTSLDNRAIRPPLITSAGDLMIGNALDTVFNNAKDTSGCQSGGGNLCALTGLKAIDGPNPVANAPHPNPPGLVFPPLCLQPFIGGAEPTSAFSTLTSGGNVLISGDPFGDPLGGLPPTGLLSSFGNSGFFGPNSPALPLGACGPYGMRQQIGHFLYLVDRARREVVVLNSNRFTVLDRISLPDPTDLAMSPNMDFMAVSNQNANVVSFVDINPGSASFHKIVKTTQVGAGPRGIAWDPGNEALLVCNELDNTVSNISAFNFDVRKVLKNTLSKPFDVAITQRQSGFGWNRNVWFGWILNRDGRLAIYESGPSGINGWGYDDIVGAANFTMEEPQRIIADPRETRGAVWVAHQNQLSPDGSPSGLTGGALTQVVIDSTTTGIIPLNSANLGTPQFRQMSIVVQGSFGNGILTGVPTDIALDDMANNSLTPNLLSPYGAGVPLAVNGKALVRSQFQNGNNTGNVVIAKLPEYLFAAIPNSSEGPGVVDVLKISTGLSRFDTDAYLSGIQSIPVPGVRGLTDYWRQ